jgi:hypothetical protein
MFTLFYLGSLLILLGSIWFAVLGFLNGRSLGEKIVWVIVNLLFQPIGGIIFLIVKRTGLIPLLLVIAGYVLIVIAYPTIMHGMIGTIPS